jgi:hypothetical protein
MESTTFQKTYDFYKHLYQTLQTIPKRDRFTWGEKIENVSLEVLKDTARASFMSGLKKRVVLEDVSEHVDLLKILLRLGWELRIIDQKKFIARQGEIQEIGKMLGTWIKRV